MLCKDCFNLRLRIKVHKRPLKTLLSPPTVKRGLVKIFCQKDNLIANNGKSRLVFTLETVKSLSPGGKCEFFDAEFDAE